MASPDGDVRAGAGPGRGAWLCVTSPACFEAALRRGALARALRRGAFTTTEIASVRARLFENTDEESPT